MTWVIRERVDALLGFDTVGAQGLLDVKAVLLCKREVRKHLAESTCACLFGNFIITRCANKHQQCMILYEGSQTLLLTIVHWSDHLRLVMSRFLFLIIIFRKI